MRYVATVNELRITWCPEPADGSLPDGAFRFAKKSYANAVAKRVRGDGRNCEVCEVRG